MKLTGEHCENGVSERRFELEVAGAAVPGVLWTPEGARGPRPLILFGHGGGQHKKAAPVLGTAMRYAKALGYAIVAIDAPDHGARVSPQDAPQVAQRERELIIRAGGMRGEALESAMRRAAIVQAEWAATLDAVLTLDIVGSHGSVGYLGLSMGAILGLPFIASEPRVKAAALGLVGAYGADHPLLQAARRITIPVEFVMQWDDTFVPREDALTLFAAFASSEKSLHANPGDHADVPAFERTSRENFFVRHFGMVNG
ncbi:MAG TPA: dienelactone hydrolase family protein [Polyangiaceae bacterium]|nr:dienelactone hydrolase family protein [Polyangiaceae bacterium]